MASQLIKLVPGTLPGGSGYCFTNFQQLNLDIVNRISGTLADGASFFNLGNTEPSVDNRAYPWFRPSDGWWYYWQSTVGAWVRPHPITPSAKERRLWVGTVGAGSDLETYDGGQAGAVGDASGPMWEQDTAFDYRVPIGVGTFPSGTPIALSATVGEETHVITEAEMPSHTHRFDLELDGTPNGTFDYATWESSNRSSPEKPSGGITKSTGSSTAMRMIQPSLGVYFIKRSARVWVRA